MKTEVVALVSGRSARRRAVLEWAGRYVGPHGLVHVVSEAGPSSLIACTLAVSGVIYDMTEPEHTYFLEAADTLAEHGCGWRWYHAPVGARLLADTVARRYGIAVMAISRSGVLQRPSVRLQFAHAEPGD
ncbi:hypothetical protein OG225_17320 [Nocardia sp. NBC_01377]|uniref:hypothetical protein n=1 Tax=Nocardia sp. NBC_01377 TaxID=2903595 RepID=UPI00325226F4